jgi:hypothetical protein
MENNPYAPPKAPVSDFAVVDGPVTRAALPLYSPTQIAVATFISTVIAGAWLAASDYKAIGQPLKARRTLWWGAGATIVTLLLALVVPDSVPSLFPPLLIAAIVRAVAEKQLGDIHQAHLKAGGAQRSWWRVVGVALLVLAVIFMVSVLAATIYFLATGKQAV